MTQTSIPAFDALRNDLRAAGYDVSLETCERALHTVVRQYEGGLVLLAFTVRQNRLHIFDGITLKRSECALTDQTAAELLARLDA